MNQRISPQHLAATKTGICMALVAALRWRALRIAAVGGLTLFWFAGAPTASAGEACCIVTNVAKNGLITAQETRGARTFQFQMANPALLRGLRVGAPVHANFDTRQVSLDGKKTCCTILKISTAAKQPVPGTTPAAPRSSALLPGVEGQVEERGVPQQKVPPFQRHLPSPQPPKGPITSSQKDYVFKTVPSTVHNISKGTNVKVQISPGYEIFFPEVTSPGKLRVEGLTLDQMVTNFKTTKTFFPASPLEKKCCNLPRLPVGPSPQASKYFVGVGAPLIIRAEPGSDLKIKGPIFIKVLIDQNLTKAFNIPNAEVSLLTRSLHIPGGNPDLGDYLNPDVGWEPMPKPCTDAFFEWLKSHSTFDTDTLSKNRLLTALKGLLGFGYDASIGIADWRAWCRNAAELDAIWTLLALEHLPNIGGEYLAPTVLMPGIWTSSLSNVRLKERMKSTNPQR